MKPFTTSVLALSFACAAAKDSTNFTELTEELDPRSLRGGGWNSGKNRCKNDRVTTKFPDLKLSPDNEVAPFTGVPFAFGTADVHIIATDVNMCRGPIKYYACVSADIKGFNPMAMHIHNGQVFANGDIVVDFTPLLDGSNCVHGCVEISSMELYTALITSPDIYYVNTHVGGEAPLILQAIRGQLVQGFMAKLENSQTVAPFNVNVAGASGMAKVSFESAGSIACFDVTINGFDPLLGHVHNSTVGTNGPRIFDYSSLKVGPGRFFGCLTVGELGVSVEQIAMILKDPEMYYFDYHLTAEEPSIFTSIRGQFPMN